MESSFISFHPCSCARLKLRMETYFHFLRINQFYDASKTHCYMRLSYLYTILSIHRNKVKEYILFSDMQTIIMYPTNATSLMLGRRLISEGHNLSLFCPNDTHIRQAYSIPTELKLAAVDAGTTVETRSSIDCFPSMDFVLFPTLDVLPDLDRPALGKICRDLFRYYSHQSKNKL